LFLLAWQTGRPWLQFDSERGMICSKSEISNVNYNRKQEREDLLIVEESQEVEREKQYVERGGEEKKKMDCL
jgi:hypothetical protein